MLISAEEDIPSDFVSSTSNIDDVRLSTTNEGVLVVKVNWPGEGDSPSDGIIKTIVGGKTLALVIDENEGFTIQAITWTDSVTKDKILAEANRIRNQLMDDACISGATFTLPGGLKTAGGPTKDGNNISAPVTDVTAGGWAYENGVFTVDDTNAGSIATAVWTVYQNSREATVTLTLTGNNGEATFVRTSVEVSNVSDAP